MHHRPGRRPRKCVRTCAPHPSHPDTPARAAVLTLASRSYAMLLGASQSVEEHGRQGAAVATTVVQACDTDASGNKVPALSAIESSTPAQRLSWMTSLCAVSQAKDSLQQLPAGLVLPALAARTDTSLNKEGKPQPKPHTLFRVVPVLNR